MGHTVRNEAPKRRRNRVAREPQPVTQRLLFAEIPHAGDETESGRDGCLCGSEEKPRCHDPGKAVCRCVACEDDAPDQTVTVGELAPWNRGQGPYKHDAMNFPMGSRTMSMEPGYEKKR